VDLAYRLRLDRWQGEERLQLELVALRPGMVDGVVVRHRERNYHCRRQGEELLIRNDAGMELRASMEDDASQHPYVRRLVQVAALALGVTV
jgi:single-stranded-DNA-specific exonuclease